MKKIVLFAAALMVALTVNAQMIAPLQIELVKYDLDSIRLRSVNNPNALLAELQTIEAEQGNVTQAIKQAGKQLKQEKTYLKEFNALLGKVDKSLHAVDKNFQSTNKTLISLRNASESTYSDIQKLDMLTSYAKDTSLHVIAEEKKLVEGGISTSAEYMRQIAMQYNTITKEKAILQQLTAEVASKEAQLKSLEAQHKNEMAGIKAQIKAAKEMVKASKK